MSKSSAITCLWLRMVMPAYFGAFGGQFQHLHNLLVQSYLSD